MKSADRKIDTLEMTNQDLQASVLKLGNAEVKYELTTAELKEIKQQIKSYKHDLEDPFISNATLTKEKEESESSLASTVTKLEDCKYEISKMTKQIEDMRDELTKPRGLDNDESRSEAMSTSIVSKVEESNRMRDVEDSFEDKYSKFKLVAIKLKKKVVDQGKIIKELQSKSLKTGI